jgi:hypothetical protein
LGRFVDNGIIAGDFGCDSVEMDDNVSKVYCGANVQEEVPIQDIGIRLDEGLLVNDGSDESKRCLLN